MRRHVVILGDIACVLTVALLMVGCSQTQRDFEQATRQDTEQGYRDFIRAHEQHDLAREARTRLESLMYRAAMNAADETVVHRFIAEFPNSERAPEAQKRLEAIALETARKQSSPAALEAFLATYPATAQADSVRKEIEALVTQRFRLKASDRITGVVNIDMQGNWNLDVPGKGIKIGNLAFTEASKITILMKDRTLLAEKAGISAKDDSGRTWQSQKVKLQGREVYAFFALPLG
jgi:hypothetical protein